MINTTDQGMNKDIVICLYAFPRPKMENAEHNNILHTMYQPPPIFDPSLQQSNLLVKSHYLHMTFPD